MYIYIYIFPLKGSIGPFERNIRENNGNTMNNPNINSISFGFLVVSEVPELYRKLREACRKNSVVRRLNPNSWGL